VRVAIAEPADLAGAGPVTGVPARRRAPDAFEWGVLALMLALSLWVVGSDIRQAIVHDQVWTHTDGFFSGDQLQYLSWIQSSAQHGLISNLFVLRPTPADYFQPAIIVSGLLVRLGMPAWLALLLWKPVAVIGLFAAVRALAHRLFERRADRRVALVLGLLFGSLSAVYGSLGVVGDMMPMWLSWGYPFALMAVALIVVALLRYDRARSAGRVSWTPGLLGALAGTVHPWQTELMLLILAFAELCRAPATLRALRGRPLREWLRDPRLALPLITMAVMLVPLVYYVALGHFDITWKLARQASKHGFSFAAVAIAAAPLAVFAALGYRGRPASFLELLVRAWTPAALLIYVLSVTTLGATPLHAVDGLSIPLAMLAVLGVRRTALHRIPRGRAVAVAAVLLGTVPANVYTLSYAHRYTDKAPGNANYVSHDEQHALDYLASDPTAGGVLSRFYLGEALPGLTGRNGFTGDCIWSEPRCLDRASAADSLLAGRMSPPAARRFVRQSGARFLLAGCDGHVNLRRWLGSMIVSQRRFGCADVYQLVAPGPPSGPFVSVPTAHHRV
jgi:hypothetical protein